MLLLTGATGFIGGHVARLLASQGADLRLLVRPTSDRRTLEGLEAAEIVEGDLLDRDSLGRAARGCSGVYHVAADYRLWAAAPGDLVRNNVEGTRNLLAAAAEAGADQIVYTSTVGTVGFSADGSPADETSPADPRDLSGPYKRSKLDAERVALDYAAQGLPVVVVNPTAPVGERDWKPTPTGKIIVDFLHGAMPAYLDTGLNLVDVRDVARGHLLAAERGRPGERYLLGARNMTLREIFEALAAITGRSTPRVRIPYAVARLVAAFEAPVARLTGREPRASVEAVRMARKKMFVSCAKAERELGLRPRPVEEALERAVEWFLANRYC